MPLVKHTLTFDAGVWSPMMDGRTDLAKYSAACRRLDNFLSRPQGAASKRPGMEYRGRVYPGGSNGRLIEFEMKGSNSIILAVSFGKMKFFKDGDPIQYSGSDLTLTVPWADGSLELLRWKQLNDVMWLVHPDYPPKVLTRVSDTSWDLSNFVPGKRHAFLPDNLDNAKRITATFKVNVDKTIWPTLPGGQTQYKVGDRVIRSGVYYNCEQQHTPSGANQPEDKPTYFDADEEEDRLLWTREYVDESSTVGQTVTLTSNKALWNANHVDSFWELASKRGTWAYETRLPVNKTATGNTYVQSKALVVQGRWTFQTFGNWNGKYYVQISRDRGKSWSTLRAFQSTAKTPRNASAEGTVPKRALLRLNFGGYGAQGTSGSPFAMLTVEGEFVRGIVKITELVSDSGGKSVKAITITPIEKETTDTWAEGAWSAYQGYPRAIEFHQNRVILAGTTKSPHTLWGSADDDYNNFYRGTLATDPWAHTAMIGQREPISWLLSDRTLLIGSGVAVFSMYGAATDKQITAEDRNIERHSPVGSALKGAGVVPADGAALFIQHGGRIVRELAYKYESDRFESSNLNLLADHLFTSEITDFAVQRQPFQVVWFISGGKLFSLTYERGQNIAGWSYHPTAGTVLSVACIRKTQEDEVWFIMSHGGTLTVERFRPAALVAPVDDGYWSDCAAAIASPYVLTGHPLAGLTVVGWNNGNVIGPATLNSGFFTGLSGTVIVGRPFTAVLEPLTPEVPLSNGSSRTREARIHAVVPSFYKSRGGKFGEDPAGTKFDDFRIGAVGTLFTGEKEMLFDGNHTTAGSFCIVSTEPFPFTVRSVALKMNFFGDAS